MADATELGIEVDMSSTIRMYAPAPAEGAKCACQAQPNGPLKGTSAVEQEQTDADRLARRLRSGTIRWDLVSRVRREIQEGTFETPERIEATVDKLLDELYGP